MSNSLDTYRNILIKVEQNNYSQGENPDADESGTILSLQRAELIEGFTDATTRIGTSAVAVTPGLTIKGAMILNEIKPTDRWQEIKDKAVDAIFQGGAGSVIQFIIKAASNIASN